MLKRVLSLLVVTVLVFSTLVGYGASKKSASTSNAAYKGEVIMNKTSK
jgi:hypothetical protein